MSSQHGSGLKNSRPQKHRNKFAFKNDLHDKTPQMKKINSLNVCEVCERCKAQIQWKIKYKKYKPLSQAKTCIKCNNRTVTKAYHVVCKECAKRERICAKCLKSAELVKIEPPEPTPTEQQKLQVEMERLTKSLSERKRRSFIRFMNVGKVNENERYNDKNYDDDDDVDDENVGERKRIPRIPHSRDELLRKIEMLKINEDDEDDDADEYDEEDGDDEDDADCADSDDEDDKCDFNEKMKPLTR